MEKLDLYVLIGMIVFIVVTFLSVVHLLPISFVVISLIFVLFHSIIKYRLRKTILFSSISWLLGFFSELLGAKYGLIFGRYVYTKTALMFFDLIPFETPISWVVISYMAYNISDALFGYDLLIGRSSARKKYSVVLLSSSLAGMSAVSLDMILDPVNVHARVPCWLWLDAGPYFGIPLSNFLGWFLLIFIIASILRLYESFDHIRTEVYSFSFEYAPTLLYFIYFLNQATYAVYIGRVDYALIGASSMLPFVLTSGCAILRRIGIG